MTKTAVFSECRMYRYVLTRFWGEGKRYVLFIMLNPSTADEIANDPTVERCERRARMWGYDGLVVVNVFAYRSTDPRVLPELHDPVGPENNRHILEQAAGADLIVCAWGQHARLRDRGNEVKKLLRKYKLSALKVSEVTGQPHHPLYLKYTLTPFTWQRAAWN